MFQAFATFHFRQHFPGFPQKLEDAARIDGTDFDTFWRVVVANPLGFVSAIGSGINE